jgi:hypothetical protein
MNLVSDQFIPMPGFMSTSTTANMSLLPFTYVDNALFFGPDKALVKKLKSKFMQKWECRDLGSTKEFLHMQITWKGESIEIDQHPYFEKVLEHCSMQDANPAPMPLPAGYIPEPNTSTASPELRSRFQTIIGSLLYLMLGIFPDIVKVCDLTLCCSSPGNSKGHWRLVRVFRGVPGCVPERMYSLDVHPV